MRITRAPIDGVHVIDIEPREDARGLFARTVCREEFARHGLNADFVQQSVSWNPRKGTLRGLHYQASPHGEDKLVRVTRGAVFDVAVDIRPGSPTRGRWFGVELSAENRRQLYIPKGFAHGFQTLLPDTEILYEMTAPFHAGSATGIRWDDPALAIGWPEAERIMSDRDLALPRFQPN
ncbi:dTDP-4-dehydrorhamnose 3,5-epimerase [Inquilinus sp. CAU 1745]|uniref:dTDP-4-dehydrorhamnose 3,5-epimerase n=1 Tax=Inquilinus sp. CAU 1745 TaxID=3140369 RepID=UPI00325A84B6